ncbi:tetratricopeptide repeat protein [Myxococcus xanthus]|uniref:Serine/threonine protein kinase n=1 Tax=Myxococcus xanthus TaxID=34 RepID=A0A7Y4MTC6_MYXXA|nr:tetratricopeptide repeat protein [Myxococcus xanthus]NOJ81986.1 serine/threonine protein kinase [Myxococcus xanthus]NOJ89519.1 serine/threonine protein kinase [Myxococcus xanthus]
MACLDENTFVALLMGGLPPARATEVDAHLDTCSACRRMVAEALRAQAPDDVPPGATTARTNARPPSGKGPSLERGTAVGRYLVLERLASGGMGVVYSAYDPELDRRVALKLLRVAALGLEAEQGRAHLLHEAQAMARVSHPHVVPVYDVGTFGPQVFLTMELVDARTLRPWLKDAPRTWRQVLALFLDAGRGLAAAHAAGVVHGDFKPENLLVGQDGRVRVTDFGLARNANPLDDVSPLAGGTPAYMAPEQMEAHAPADARSDQFAFCVTLYEALYGERPFAATTPHELLTDVRAGKVRPAPRGTHVPPWLRRVLLRGLSASAMDRYTDLDALLVALQHDPASRWKRWVPAVGGAALLLLAVGLTHAVHASRARACQRADAAMASVWGPEAQQTIESAFLATGKPFAPAAWLRVRRSLDAYTAEWASMRTSACEATRVRGEQSEQVLARRMHCLDERLAEVAALTQLFTRADAGTVELAARAAEALPPLGRCSDLAALAAREPNPTDGASLERARTLVRVRALKAAGKYAEAVALLEPVVKAAKDADDRHGGADALLLMGQLREEAGQPRDAETTYFDAVWNAEAGRNDVAAARAWTRLVHASGYVLDQHALGHRWRERAEAAIERLGGDGVLRAQLQARVGALLFAQGRYTEAAEQQESALSRLEATYGPDSLEVTDVRLELGATRMAQLRADEAMRLFEQALSTRRAALGPSHPDVARAQLELAYAHWRRSDVEQVEALARGALEVFERALGPEHPDVASAINLLAAALQRMNRSEEALRLQERALDIALKVEGADGAGALITSGNLATLMARAGRSEEALTRFHTMLAPLEQRLGAQHPYVAQTLRATGRLLMMDQRYTEALPYLERARAILDAREDDAYGYRTGTLMDLGRALLALDRPRQAAELLERVVASGARSPQAPSEQARARFLLAQALWDAKRDRPRALQLAEEARKSLVTLGTSGQEALEEMDAWRARLPRPTHIPAARAP